MLNRIEEFKKRIEVDGRDFCESLYQYATVRLLAHKYSYYIMNESIIDDITYDLEERSWYIMGRALGHLKEDETSPCIDFDEKHPLATQSIELALSLPKKRN